MKTRIPSLGNLWRGEGAFMKDVAKKYDPLGIYQTLLPGGSKISKVQIYHSIFAKWLWLVDMFSTAGRSATRPPGLRSHNRGDARRTSHLSRYAQDSVRRAAWREIPKQVNCKPFLRFVFAMALNTGRGACCSTISLIFRGWAAPSPPLAFVATTNDNLCNSSVLTVLRTSK